MLRAIIKLNLSIRCSVQSSRSYVRRGKEPGIRARLELFSEDFIKNDPEMIEDTEADFMNVHKAHKQFEKEEKQFDEKVSSLIVGQKYFKEKSVNFLTFAEKEQIRALHEQDSDNWTIDKLSQAFPADPKTISKIIRNRLFRKTEMEVTKHDEAVRQCWIKFKKDEFQIDPILTAHLKKFAYRNFSEACKSKLPMQVPFQFPKPSTNEFSSIITSCKKYADPKPQENLKQIDSSKNLKFPEGPPSDRDDFVILEDGAPNKLRPMTLNVYQQYSSDVVCQDTSEAVKPHRSETMPDLRNFKRHQETSLDTMKFDHSKIFRELSIEERISIPKKLWKRDQIYRVSDCFYDDDGEFLYRVPGLK